MRRISALLIMGGVMMFAGLVWLAAAQVPASGGDLQPGVASTAEIVRALPPRVAPVGVFVDEEPGAILRLADEVGFGVVQLHGDEPPGVLAALGGLKVIKAFRVADEGDVLLAREWKQESERLGQPADGYLVDACVAGGPKGGSGQLADWGLAARMISEGFRPLILAGGLSPDNVAEAIRAVRPWGVDGSTGLESAPGVKDLDKIRAFVAAVRKASGKVTE